MKVALDIYAVKPVAVRQGCCVSTSLTSGGLVIPGSPGWDSFAGDCLIQAGKRLAGAGRRALYRPMGPRGPAEVRPGACFDIGEPVGETVLLIENNLILDQGILTDCLGIRLVSGPGFIYDLPLKRPDIKINWPARGVFAISVGQFLTAVISASTPVQQKIKWDTAAT